MTGYSEFPSNIQTVIDELQERGYNVGYGEVEGELGGPGFVATTDSTHVQITDHVQTWFVTLHADDRPNIDDCWCHPGRVRREVGQWLEESGNGGD